MSRDISDTKFIGGLMLLVLIILGWIANIVKLASVDVFTGMEVARAIGVFIAPLGAILGYF